jgi:hypothetical protein
MSFLGVGSSLSRETCRPEESLACIEGRMKAMVETLDFGEEMAVPGCRKPKIVQKNSDVCPPLSHQDSYRVSY